MVCTFPAMSSVSPPNNGAPLEPFVLRQHKNHKRTDNNAMPKTEPITIATMVALSVSSGVSFAGISFPLSEDVEDDVFESVTSEVFTGVDVNIELVVNVEVEVVDVNFVVEEVIDDVLDVEVVDVVAFVVEVDPKSTLNVLTFSKGQQYFVVLLSIMSPFSIHPPYKLLILL